ncbi:protein bir1 [Aspergillus udagawae]|uniref:Protein bir1 n=1 Tax=Aspergillus udagawae TaxID=91492 RepID=A0ABQ0ZYX5_9EURO|nr:protein bir1 [Aspergillus udagawae]
MVQEMETFAARLASFDLVLHPERRRTSSAKSVKPISWPHSRPSPAELAHAGFYYNPYETNPDNTTCYLCQRALDGWESEDNPITEHLKHSKDCGWAIMMDIEQHSSNPAEIEDPTSDRIEQARQATFGDQWPHDGKRGWVCQSEKMVEGGWYFCPTEESNDLASCAYCKLSLDGWEPKDDPFEEHYRRSADCSFFVFAQPSGKKSKSSRSKKSRVSKGSSRLSTQSTVSEAPMSGLDNQMDEDDIPQPPTKTKPSKKSSKSKSKTSKSKKDDTLELDNQMDLDTMEYDQPEPAKPKRTRGKKRSSEEMDPEESSMAIAEEIHQSEPPTKKRATKSRNSATQREDSTRSDVAIADMHEPDDEALLEAEAKKGRAATKKKTSSRVRKVSEDSSVEKAAPQARLPRDSEIDAAIEAELEVNEPPAETHKSSKKSKSKKKTKKAAEEPPKVQHDTVERSEEQELRRVDDDEFIYRRTSDVQMPAEQPKPAKSTTKQRTSKEARLLEKKTSESTKSRPATKVGAADVDAEADRRHQGSFVSVEVTARSPEQDFEPEGRDSDSQTKKATKKSTTSKAKKTSHTRAVSPESLEPSEAATPASERPETRHSLKPEAPLQFEQRKISRHSQDDVQELELEPESEPELEKDPEDDIEQDTEVDPEPEPEPQLEVNETPARRRSSKVPPKTTERFSDIPQEKQFAKSIAETRTPNSHKVPQARINSARQESDAVSPLPSTSKGSPSSSPQSSDAENQPPTIQTSALRTQLASPSKEKVVRIPLATSTPSPSKRNVNPGALKTLHPWTPIDIDEILYASMSDKENVDVGAALNSIKGDLTSPEKKMTVEEWIFWHARNGEEKLKRECERLVSQFEKEGARAMRALEGIECID